VYAVDSGYVSRIKVDLNGFGKALYIDHPNGTTSVYGHLEVLREDIDRYCKREQYKMKQFGIDLTVPPNELLVKRGDVIAFAGNRGSSSGPHLHFEVRDTRTQITLNVFRFTNLTIPDTIPPIIEKLWLYPLDQESEVNSERKPVDYPVTTMNGESKINPSSPLTASGNVGIGIQVYDLSNNSVNKIGIYSIEMFVDDTLVFDQVLDKLSFSEMRYINSLIDYGQYIKYGVRINRLFVQPNNQLNNYYNIKKHGIISFTDTSIKTIRIRVTDDFSNRNECTLSIKGRANRLKIDSTRSSPSEGSFLMHYSTHNIYRTNTIRLYLPKDALYDDLYFEYFKSAHRKGYFSDVHHVHNSYTPLHKSCELSIKPFGLPPALVNKSLLISTDQAGRVTWSGGAYKNGFVTANILTFGNYMVGIDTVPPQVLPLFTNVPNNNFTTWDRLAFTIKDNLSGISNYAGTIDGQWVLFEYDPKQDLLYYEFDPDRMKFGQEHELKLIVSDKKGNVTVYKLDFLK